MYLPEYVLELPSAGGGADIYMLEALLEDTFVKYSSNMGWLNPRVNAELVHAFSHFTYVHSEGRLMVTDLQGSNKGTAFTLTDPAIHCPVDLRRFTGTNFGTDGVIAVLRSHVCGATCKALGLKAVVTPGMAPADVQYSLVSYVESCTIYE